MPETTPLLGSMPRPVGRPVADQPRADPLASAPAIGSATAPPSTPDWSAGAVTVTGSVTVHRNVWPALPLASVKVAVTT